MKDESVSPAFFPRTYITELFRFINANAGQIQCITYKDFLWGNDFSHETGYLDEWRAWGQALANGRLDPHKIYLLIQYDVDTTPERTMALLREPEHESIPANIMIFAKRLDRKNLIATRNAEPTVYELDDGLLRARCARGSVVGFHFNSYERSLWNASRAGEIFAEDLAELRHRFSIEFCSAHGGVPDADGRNNNSIEIPENLRTSIRWVHNKYSPRFSGQFSDGGHQGHKINPARRDIRDFVKSWQPGGRYRLLLHPQYYDPDFVPSPSFSGTPWYDRLIADARTGLTSVNVGFELTPPGMLGQIAKYRAKERTKEKDKTSQPTPFDKPVRPSLSARLRHRAFAYMARFHKPLRTINKGFDGQVLIESSSSHGPSISNWTTSKGVFVGGTPGHFTFPNASAGHVLIGGGFWGGVYCFSFYRMKGIKAFTDAGDRETLPWGGWPTSKNWEFHLQVRIEGDDLPLRLQVICLSYDKTGRLISQRKIGILSERTKMLDAKFRPDSNAIGFNIAIYKADDQPGAAVTFSNVKLTRTIGL